MRKQIDQTREFSIAQPLRALLEWLEVKCSIECCGVDALKVSEAMVEIWAGSAGKEKVGAAVKQAREIVRLLNEAKERLSCAWLNYREHVEQDRTRLKELLEEVIGALEGRMKKIGAEESR